MSLKQTHIYLASQSPRRRELLKQIGVHFELLLLRSDTRRRVDVDETPHTGETPEIYVQRLSREKAASGFEALLFRNLSPFPVLAADTTVTLEGKIMGKPADADEATTMLRALSGREHQVLTSVAIAHGEHIEVALSTSTVRMTALSEERIKRYLQSNEYADKAGAYAIQGQAGAFIEHIGGSYSGVMGLPLFETVQLLHYFNYPSP
jgi:septum formation protein